MNSIEITGLRYGIRPHFWSSRRQILRGVTLTVERGEIFGFLGPNGAGKTTTIKVLLGLLQPDAGATFIFGSSPKNTEVRRRLGFMPERAYFPEHLTARELLVAHGVLAGLPRSEARRRAAELLELVGLERAADQRLSSFSKGMQQRVGLGQALIARPELVILDEPMSGLDPIGRLEVRELMLRLRDDGVTIFFSTHIIPDVEAICDRVAILVAGTVRWIESVSSLLSNTTDQVDVIFQGCPDAALAALADLGPVVHRGGTRRLTVVGSAEANQAIDQLRVVGATILTVQTRRRSLEDIIVNEASRSLGEGV